MSLSRVLERLIYRDYDHPQMQHGLYLLCFPWEPTDEKKCYYRRVMSTKAKHVLRNSSIIYRINLMDCIE